MTGRKMRKISLYVTIFFLVLTILSSYKSKDETAIGTEDLTTYDFINNEGGLELIEDSAYVFEREYNLSGDTSEEDSMELAVNDIKNYTAEKEKNKEKQEKSKKDLVANSKKNDKKESVDNKKIDKKKVQVRSLIHRRNHKMPNLYFYLKVVKQS